MQHLRTASQWVKDLASGPGDQLGPGSRIPLLFDLKGGDILNPPFSDDSDVPAISFANNVIQQPWFNQGKWRTTTKSGVAAADGTVTIQMLASDVQSGVTRIYAPWIIIHMSPQAVSGVANAQYVITIKHDIDNRSSVSYKFTVRPMDLSATIMYLGADIIDTQGVYKGLVIGNLAINGARTEAAKRRFQVEFSGLPASSQVYIELPSRDHPFANAMVDAIIGGMNASYS
jgi:hypothetical protein